jgi:hypothetical protein
MRQRRAWGLLAAIAALAGGCSGAPQAGGADGGPFIAFAGDFKGFHDWPNQAEATPAAELPPVDAGALTGDGGIHAGPQREYWNRNPPAGSSSFPIGTMIVKETEEADPTARHVFAMAKRGAGFNAAGAAGWEFYELKNSPDGSVSVQWQGYGPTSGSTDVYGGDPNVCNDCHGLARANDFVFGAALQLANF